MSYNWNWLAKASVIYLFKLRVSKLISLFEQYRAVFVLLRFIIIFWINKKQDDFVCAAGRFCVFALNTFFWMQFQFYWISISAHEQSIQKTVRGKKNISRKNNVFNIEYCLTIIVFSLPLSPECVLSNDNNHGAISTVNTQSRTNPTRTCVVSIYFCEAFRVFWRLATLKYGFDSMAAKKLVNISMEINIWVECLLKKNTRP